MSPQIAQIILIEYTVRVQHSPRAHIKHKQFIKKLNSLGGAILMTDELRIAPQWAILRWAILSPSVIRIAHPNY